MLVVGSKALSQYYTLDRDIKDVDIICSRKDVEDLLPILRPTEIKEGPGYITFKGIQNKLGLFDKNNVEFLLDDDSTSLKMYRQRDMGKIYASKEVLLSLKKSHIHFNVKFDKHIQDYQLLLNDLKEDVLKDITKINFKETERRLGELKTPKLKNKTMKFFKQSEKFVKYYFVHDHIHEIMAHYDRPLYERLQRDGESAWCEKDLWNLLSYEDKCKCVLEEAYVIAMERKLIPMLFGDNVGMWTPETALKWSMKRICTNLCSGWFREFATNNYNNIFGYSSNDYFVKFLEAYKEGKIKKKENDK